MKRFLIMICIITLVSSFGYSENKNKKYQTKIKKGTYIATDLVTSTKIKNLPIPNTGEDYAFFQSIGKTSNIVVGNFINGDNKITFISDKNGDGIVDEMVYWFEERQKFQNVPHPELVVSAEKFKNMKIAIINGSRTEYQPNEEGLNYLKKIIEKKDKNTIIEKVNQGFTVRVVDPDDEAVSRLAFSYGDNGVNGVDVIFTVKYHNVGATLVQPVIESSVYCKNSFDPVVKETITDLSSQTIKSLTGK